jgi:hypothetical protein
MVTAGAIAFSAGGFCGAAATGYRPGRSRRRCRPLQRPRLSRRPGDHVHTVPGLVDVRLEFAVGAVAAADAPGRPRRTRPGLRGECRTSLTRRWSSGPCHTGRGPAARRRRPILQPEYVGGEPNAVGHRHHDVLVDHDHWGRVSGVALYSSSPTCSPQWTATCSSSTSLSARWTISRVGVAPCQCSSSGSM